MATKLKTTVVGYVNRNRQIVVGKSSVPDNDHHRIVYRLRCLNPECRHEYGAIGSEIFQRKCPRCQGGRPGLPIPESKTPSEVLDEIADLYEDVGGEPFSGRDHDKVLYGDKGAR